MNNTIQSLKWLTLVPLTGMLLACGGGGSGGTEPPGPPTARGFDNAVEALALATDGSGDVYAGGKFSAYGPDAAGRLIRLNRDGSPDTAFDIGSGLDGIVLALAAAVDGSGDLYVGGDFSRIRGQAASSIVRLNADGSVDSQFHVGKGFVGSVSAIAPARDGSGDVYVGGWFFRYRGELVQPVVRLNPDGSLDRGFDLGSGWSRSDGYLPVVGAIAGPDQNGHIVVAGNFDTFRGADAPRIVRVRSDGARDTSFDAGSGFDGWVQTLAHAVDGSGDVYAGGSFSSYRQAATKGLARINADGTRDTDFEVGSGFIPSPGVGGVWALLPRTDGSIDVGGGIDTYRGAAVGHFVHIRADGQRLDSDFARRSFDQPVRALARNDDGSGGFFAGGDFIRFDGSDARRLVRLHADGSADGAFEATR